MQLQEALDNVAVRKPISWKHLQVFPLVQPNGRPPSYALIDDLLERQQAEITEVTEGGSVPTVLVKNHADLDALILDGTELRGAKQNRMVNVTVIVARMSDTPIPVSCVEQGRWSYRSRHFQSAKRTVASKLRNRKAHMVAESLARARHAHTAQGAVWDRVDAYCRDAGAHSHTAAMDDVFAARQREVETFVAKLKDIAAQGAVVGINGEIIAVDLVDHPVTFAKLWQMLLHGYAMDAALETECVRKPLTQRRVEKWLKEIVAEATVTPHHVAGVGEYYAVRGSNVAGGVVLHHGRAVHVALFPRIEELAEEGASQ
jgi:flavodoxin